jgi:hypothetical protein
MKQEEVAKKLAALEKGGNAEFNTESCVLF